MIRLVITTNTPIKADTFSGKKENDIENIVPDPSLGIMGN